MGAQRRKLSRRPKPATGSTINSLWQELRILQDVRARAGRKLRRRSRLTTLRAVSAKFEKSEGKIVVELSTGLTISFRPRDAQGLEAAAPGDLKQIEISPSGFGLYFPRLDADLYIPALLEGFFGSRRWMAARLGERGGKATSQAGARAGLNARAHRSAWLRTILRSWVSSMSARSSRSSASTMPGRASRSLRTTQPWPRSRKSRRSRMSSIASSLS